MKRIVSLVLAISMVLSMFVSALAATKTFDDVKDTAYAGSVEALVELGVIDGLPDGTFGPEKQVTRAQLAKMLVICLGLGDTVESLEGRTVFSDVAENHWASGYINAAVQSKVIAGYPDGTFKPEKNVSYAEAVTMVIRALGYGNVVDKEGTWPTAYMLKAIELKLLDDMTNSPKSSEAATRGNTAILLWNMLRTPMWKIQSESEGDGMTSYATTDMIEVKFPDYKYFDEAYLTDVTVTEDEVKATVKSEKGTQTAYIEDMDLSKLVIGMKVAALVKDYKDKDDATFLTLTPAYSFVEGFVTKVSATKLEIDDVEYKLDGADKIVKADGEKLAIDDYVLVEVDGKKVTEYDKVPVLKVLPTEGTEILTANSIESEIDDEDALVIIDGEWATRDDVEAGDVYTELTGFGDSYYMVARERLTGDFESYSVEKGESEKVYLEIDGEEYKALASNFQAYDGEKNRDKVPASELRKEEKENKYIGQEVEMVLNYLGQIVKLNFGDVSEKNSGNFYVVVSDGAYTEPGDKGVKYYVSLAGADGEVEKYQLETKALAEKIGVNENATIYADCANGADPVYVWVEFDKEVIDTLEVVDAGDVFDERYVVESFSGDLDDDNYLNNDSNSKVTASTLVYTATPVKDDDEEDVVDIEVEVTEGTAAIDGVKGGLVVYDSTKSTTRAKFVFVADEAKSKDLHFGKVTKDVTERAGVNYITVDGEEYELNKKNQVEFVKGDVVGYTVDDEEVTIKYLLVPADLDDNADVIEKVEDGELIFVDGSTLDTERESVVDDYEKADFVLVNAKKKDNKVEFTSVEELGKGINADHFTYGDRMIAISEDGKVKVVFVVTGFDYEDEFVAGEYVGTRDTEKEPDTPAVPEVFSGDVVYEFSGDVPAGLTAPEAEVKKSGDEVTLPSVENIPEGYVLGWESEDVEISDGKFTMPGHDVKVVGKWTKLYKVSYEVIGDDTSYTAPEGKYYKSGDSVKVEDKPVDDSDYTYTDWEAVPTVTVDNGTFKMPAEDVTFTSTSTAA